jgi:hypothetical protein
MRALTQFRVRRKSQTQLAKPPYDIWIAMRDLAEVLIEVDAPGTICAKSGNAKQSLESAAALLGHASRETRRSV